MKQTAVEWLIEKRATGDLCFSDFLTAKEMEKQQQGYSDEEAMEFFIEGYKQRAEKSDLIFDNASRMYAIHLFEQYYKETFNK